MSGHFLQDRHNESVSACLPSGLHTLRASFAAREMKMGTQNENALFGIFMLMINGTIILLPLCLPFNFWIICFVIYVWNEMKVFMTNITVFIFVNILGLFLHQ
jgi:hypothetical protein